MQQKTLKITKQARLSTGPKMRGPEMTQDTPKIILINMMAKMSLQLSTKLKMKRLIMRHLLLI